MKKIQRRMRSQSLSCAATEKKKKFKMKKEIIGKRNERLYLGAVQLDKGNCMPLMKTEA